MENVLKAFANMLKPYLEPETPPVESYDLNNLGLTRAEQIEKHVEGIKVFERAVFETYWNIEKLMLEIENLKNIEGQLIRALNVAEGVDVEGYIKENGSRDDVKEVLKTRAKVQNKQSSLAEEMDKCFQQEAFVTTLRRRVELALKDGVELRTFKFKTTAEIRGE